MDKLYEGMLTNYVVDPGTGCFIFAGSLDHSGYGKVKIHGKLQAAHRAAWTMSNGVIPTGMCVLHKCDNPACIRVEHLFLGTHQENMDDMKRKRRQTFGSRNPNAKLSEEDVIKIRGAVEIGASKRELAKSYGVKYTTIDYVVKHYRWQHV